MALEDSRNLNTRETNRVSLRLRLVVVLVAQLAQRMQGGGVPLGNLGDESTSIESEVLFQKGQKFRVTQSQVSDGPLGTIVMDLEEISEAA